MKTGEPRLKELRGKAADEPIEQVGRELRSLMHRAVPEREADPAA
jgi:ketol-acid reductoisomerase